jgi:hypothetical protein
LQDLGGIAPVRFSDQDVKVLGHNYISDYLKPVLASYLFEDAEKHIASTPGAKEWFSSITTTGHEVKIIEPVTALQAAWHRAALYRRHPSSPTLANCARMGHPTVWDWWRKIKNKGRGTLT